MRKFLMLYVVLFVGLNFFIDHPYIFYLAMSAFPVTVYLLVSKRRYKPKQAPPAVTTSSHRTISSPREESY